MARVTVEDCIDRVPNRFKLVLMAAKRARDIERGAKPSVVRDNDKSTVLALREIAEDAINLENLEEITKQGIINNEAELSYEQEQAEERLENITDEEIDDDEFVDEDFSDDDDDWDVSDNPYNRIHSAESTSDEENIEDLDDDEQDEYSSDDEQSDDYLFDDYLQSSSEDKEDEEPED